MRIYTPKATAMIFSTGKMTCVGTKSEDDAKAACKKFAKTIKNLGFPVKFSEFKIWNILSTCSVPFKISLTKLNAEHPKFCTFDPEFFPGLYYSILDPKMTLLIFESGKITFLGAKTVEDIEKTYKDICKFLRNYRKPAQSELATVPIAINLPWKKLKKD